MGGYHESPNPHERYGVIDRWVIRGGHVLCGHSDATQFAAHYGHWIQAVRDKGRKNQEGCWAECIAVGSCALFEETKNKFGTLAARRRIEAQEEDLVILSEESTPYDGDSCHRKRLLSAGYSSNF